MRNALQNSSRDAVRLIGVCQVDYWLRTSVALICACCFREARKHFLQLAREICNTFFFVHTFHFTLILSLFKFLGKSGNCVLWKICTHTYICITKKLIKNSRCVVTFFTIGRYLSKNKANNFYISNKDADTWFCSNGGVIFLHKYLY